MHLETLKSLYKLHKEPQLFNRYIHTKHLKPLLKEFTNVCKVDTIGKSVNGIDIFSITVGFGKKKILMWSQMHGNESTTTKAIFDLLNVLSSKNNTCKHILEAVTIKIIPILNPDGAEAYTRLNANKIDLNRDAQNLTQPESIVLRECFNSFKPDFCYNLHGQRTIFGLENSNLPATVSFLAPAQDELCTITGNRKRAMELIAAMNTILQSQIPGQVGIYNDAYNINCVGDTFQGMNIPTVLFEAGHYSNDYERESVREFIFQSLLLSVSYIAKNEVIGIDYRQYLDIPKNEKSYFDIIIRNAKVEKESTFMDIVIQYQEVLMNDMIVFMPKVEQFSSLNRFNAHKEYDAANNAVFTAENEPIFVGYENDFVFVKNEELSLKLTKT